MIVPKGTPQLPRSQVLEGLKFSLVEVQPPGLTITNPVGQNWESFPFLFGDSYSEVLFLLEVTLKNPPFVPFQSVEKWEFSKLDGVSTAPMENTGIILLKASVIVYFDPRFMTVFFVGILSIKVVVYTFKPSGENQHNSPN